MKKLILLTIFFGFLINANALVILCYANGSDDHDCYRVWGADSCDDVICDPGHCTCTEMPLSSDNGGFDDISEYDNLDIIRSGNSFTIRKNGDEVTFNLSSYFGSSVKLFRFNYIPSKIIL